MVHSGAEQDGNARDSGGGWHERPRQDQPQRNGAAEDGNAGVMFGSYRVLRKLAVGGMAEIYLALLEKEAGFRKRVALKRILPNYGNDDKFVSMFLDEARIASRLGHPNIVQIYDFGEHHGIYYIAMEYIDGCTLRALLNAAKAQGRPLTAAEVASIGEGLARGLHYVHTLTDERGAPAPIVHRDISPHNVMLTRTGDVKVMDFGIAKAAESACHTATGVIKGKLPYMSPEQARGKRATAFSDQFSAALVLWECTVQRRAFHANTAAALLRQAETCEIPPVHLYRPDLPPDLDAVLMRALLREPEARYPTLHALEHALTRFRFSLGDGGLADLSALVADLLPPRRDTDGTVDADAWNHPLWAVGREPSDWGGDTHDALVSSTQTLPRATTDAGPTPLRQHAVSSPPTAAPVPSPVVPSPMAPKRRKISSWLAWSAWGAVGALLAAAVFGLFVILRAAGPQAQIAPIDEPVRAGPSLSGGSTIKVTSEPSGAQLLVNGHDTGKQTPIHLGPVPIGQTLNLEIRLPQFSPWRTLLQVDHASMAVHAALQRAPQKGRETGREASH